LAPGLYFYNVPFDFAELPITEMYLDSLYHSIIGTVSDEDGYFQVVSEPCKRPHHTVDDMLILGMHDTLQIATSGLKSMGRERCGLSGDNSVYSECIILLKPFFCVEPTRLSWRLHGCAAEAFDF